MHNAEPQPGDPAFSTCVHCGQNIRRVAIVPPLGPVWVHPDDQTTAPVP